MCVHTCTVATTYYIYNICMYIIHTCTYIHTYINILREKSRLYVYFRNFITLHVYFRKAKSWKINTAMNVIKYGRPYFECLC